MSGGAAKNKSKTVMINICLVNAICISFLQSTVVLCMPTSMNLPVGGDHGSDSMLDFRACATVAAKPVHDGSTMAGGYLITSDCFIYRSSSPAAPLPSIQCHDTLLTGASCLPGHNIILCTTELHAT